jgi:alpha-glucosidase
MCEPAVFAAGAEPTLPLATRHDLDGRGGDHVEGRNLYGLGMAQAGHAALSAHRPERRPWLLTRSGWAGIQRYAWTWTGDVATSWTMLHRTLATALNLSMSGVAYTGPDIGGFSGDPSPELYTRWLQLAAWLPFFRSHSIFTMPSREPWRAAGPHLDAVRDAMVWRERLLPYLYTVAWRTTQGEPFVRPVWWPGDADEALFEVDDAFLVGDHVLVAPVVEAGAASREVRLPAGRWWELVGAGAHEGTVRLDVTIDRIPVLVRAGAVLPADEDGRGVLHVFPEPTAACRSTWYRDAGDGYGPHRVDLFTLTQENGSTVVRRTVSEYGFEVDDTDLAVVLPEGHWRVGVDDRDEQDAVGGQALTVGAFSVLVIRRTG